MAHNDTPINKKVLSRKEEAHAKRKSPNNMRKTLASLKGYSLLSENLILTSVYIHEGCKAFSKLLANF